MVPLRLAIILHHRQQTNFFFVLWKQQSRISFSPTSSPQKSESSRSTSD